jgi:peptide/nickel transport system substrate-binding protein
MLSPIAARGRLVPIWLIGTLLLASCAPAVPGSSAGSTPLPPAAAAPKPTPAAATSGSTSVVLADFAEPALLNPALSTESPRVSHLIFDSLVQADPRTGVATGSLAEKWEQSADGLTYTFHLRPNLKWSDGQPLTADDARFTFDLIRDPKIASPFKSNFDLVTAVDVPDPLTVRLTLSAPSCPFLLNSMTQGLLPKHALANSPDLLKDDFNTNPTTGSGPFVFKERQKADRITLVANPNYWQGKPKFDQWIFKTVADSTAEVLQLKSGEVDYAVVVPEALDELQQAGLDVKSYVPLVTEYIGYNLKRPLFEDVRVRQALTYAIDRKQIVQQVLFGQGLVAYSPIPSVSWAFNPNLPAYDYDPERARQLLADAGWAPDAAGVLRKDGQPFQFKLETNAGNKVREADIVIAQAQFKKLGIDVQTNVLELSAFNQKVKTQHDFDAVVAQPTRAIDPDQTPGWASTSYPNGQNFVAYSNPDVDQLLRQAATLPGCGQQERQQLYARVQEILAQDQPVTQLYSRKTTLAVSKRIQGFDPSPWAGDEFGIQNWLVTSR